MTKALLLGISGLALSYSAAFADGPATAEQLPKIEASLKAWGCAGGTVKVEETGFIEIDDAKCADGKEYDFKLNSDYSLHSMSQE